MEGMDGRSHIWDFLGSLELKTPDFPAGDAGSSPDQGNNSTC